MSEKPLSEVNFLRPKKGYMVGEVLITLVILIGWGGGNFRLSVSSEISGDQPGRGKSFYPVQLL